MKNRQAAYWKRIIGSVFARSAFGVAVKRCLRKKLPMNETWQQIATTFAEEFSDLPSLAEVTRIALRLLVAAILSGMLGFEREWKRKAAGLRTHMLVGLGAAIFVLVPQQAGVSEEAIARVVQGVVSGIGFLGAGSIIKGNGEGSIKGLTTAASIWLTAAIGIAAGMGRESSAIFSTVLALIILTLLLKLEQWIGTDQGKPSDILHG
jgi:putative Mg2+ transporter-C (MgtC) family protein